MIFVVNLTANSSSFKLNLSLLAIACLSGIFFLRNEKNKTNKLLELSLFKNEQFLKLLSAFFLLQYSSLSMSYLIPNVLQILFNQSPSLAGILISPTTVIDALLSVVAGIIYDKTTPRLPIISGCIIVGLTFFCAMLITPNIVGLIVIYMSFMVGISLSYSNIMTFSLSQLPVNLRNDGNAIYMTVQSYSGAVGIALASSIISFMQEQRATVIIGTKQGLEINFWLLFLVAMVTLLLCLITLKNKAH